MLRADVSAVNVMLDQRDATKVKTELLFKQKLRNALTISRVSYDSEPFIRYYPPLLSLFFFCPCHVLLILLYTSGLEIGTRWFRDP